MKKDYISKTIGGLTIMFSVFLFFAAAKQLTYQNEQILANVTSGSKKLPTQPETKTTNENVVMGNFNVESNGNVRYSYDEGQKIKFYYQAIRSEKLKNDKITPILKLEQKDENGNLVWEETKWSWIDYNQGIIYFHFQTEENGAITKKANFTGKYQIIFNN